MAPTNRTNIYFHFLSTSFSFPRRNLLKNFLHQLLKKEGKEVAHINYIFCKDDYLITLNRTHLNHDTYTDIITFELSAQGEPITADIYISIDRVKENSQTFDTSFNRELHRVIFHGALHLSGYKDKSNPQKQLMRAKEEENLNLYFVPRGTGR